MMICWIWFAYWFVSSLFADLWYRCLLIYRFWSLALGSCIVLLLALAGLGDGCWFYCNFVLLVLLVSWAFVALVWVVVAGWSLLLELLFMFCYGFVGGCMFLSVLQLVLVMGSCFSCYLSCYCTAMDIVSTMCSLVLVSPFSYAQEEWVGKTFLRRWASVSHWCN